MNQKPSLTFIYLVVLIGIVTVMGLVWAVWQGSNLPGRLPPVVTPPSPTATEQTATSSFTPSPSPRPSLTLPPYDASMSPTAAVFAGHLTPSFVHQFTPTLPPYDASMSPTAIPRSTYTPTATVEFAGCGWQWARQDLPEVTAMAQVALIRAAGLSEASVYAEAYGENCLNPDMTVRYFAAMTTDFYVSMPVDSLADLEVLTQRVVISYTTLSALPQDSFPARLGYLDFAFTSGGETRRLRAMFTEYRTAIDDGKTGQALLDALGGLR